VLVNARIDTLDFATVSTDDGAAAEQAILHLHQLGHRRIGLLLGPLDHIPSQRKLAAATAALRACCAPRWTTRWSSAACIRSIGPGGGVTPGFAAGATAIVCASDPLALGAVRAARRAGMHVPQDVSVVGFDDSALMSCTEPPLTTVRQPIESMGRTGDRTPASQIAGTTEAGDELLFEPNWSSAPRQDRSAPPA
jgi:DNA-binding LacI/PurR family transcriptional regulator